MTVRGWGSRLRGIGAPYGNEPRDGETLRACGLDEMPRLRIYRPLQGAGRKEWRHRTRVLRRPEPCPNSPQPRDSNEERTAGELRRGQPERTQAPVWQPGAACRKDSRANPSVRSCQGGEP